MLASGAVSTKTKSALVTLLMALVCVLVVPYAITTFGPQSICVSEARISGREDKIAGAVRYIQARQNSGTYPATKILTPTGAVDKGTGDDPKLGWFSYFMSGESHYVHFRETDQTNKFQKMDVIVIVNNCGAGMYRGTH
jgi:hypothetical protein